MAVIRVTHAAKQIRDLRSVLHHRPKKTASLVRKAALICIIRKPGCTYASDRNPDALMHPSGIRMHLRIRMDFLNCIYVLLF